MEYSILSEDREKSKVSKMEQIEKTNSKLYLVDANQSY